MKKTFYWTRLKAIKTGGFLPTDGIYGFEEKDFNVNIQIDEAKKLFIEDLIVGDDQIGVITFKNGEFEIYCNTDYCCLEQFVKDVEYGVYNFLKNSDVLFKSRVITLK